MTNRRKREYIKVQLLETQRMLGLVGTHPLMSMSFQQRADDLQRQLDSLPLDAREAKITLLFSGAPVLGSIGIEADFAGKVLVPFQNMVNSEFAQRMHGRVAQRGRIYDQDKSKLYITGLPRGSFGIELSKLEDDIDVDEDKLSDSLSHIAKLVDASSKSDEDFATEIADIAPRTVQSLKDFLKVMADDNAGVTLESGGIRFALAQQDVKTAFERVSNTISNEEDVVVVGRLRGILLDSWRFDFIDENGEEYTGKLSNELDEPTVTSYTANFFNNRCRATLTKTSVQFRNGTERVSYVLKSLEQIAA